MSESSSVFIQVFSSKYLPYNPKNQLWPNTTKLDLDYRELENANTKVYCIMPDI